MARLNQLPFGVSAYVPHGITGPVAEAWRAVAPPKVLFAHSKRLNEWISSRVALSEAFQEAGVFVDPGKSTFYEHRSLLEYPEWRFSISHDDLISVVWVARASDARAIGVDVEPASRHVSERVRRRMLAPGDSPELSPIALWSIKEAVFKSLPPDLQKRAGFHDIVVNADGSFHVLPTELNGSWLLKEEEASLVSYVWTNF